MRLLLVPYYFAPAGGPRSIRWTNITRYLALAGHDLTVVAADFPSDCPWMDPTLNDVAEGLEIRVHRIPIPSCSPGRRENVAWMRAARRWIRAEGGFPFDAAITSAVPIASHGVLAGLALPSSMPWIADYGDPWSQSSSRRRRFGMRTVETAYETRVLRQADAVTVTTPTAVDAFARVFPRRADIRVIPQGASFFHLAAEWGPPPMRPGPLRVLYAGGFYTGVREPTTLLEGLSLVENVELTIVGHSQMDLNERAVQFGLAGRVKVLPYVGIRDVVRMQQDAEVLLLLSWPVAEQIPGKFWEYMATSRKILYATYHPDDAIARAIREREAGSVVGHNAEAIASGLRSFLADRKAGVPLVRPPDPSVGFDARARAFLDLVEELRARRRP